MIELFTTEEFISLLQNQSCDSDVIAQNLIRLTDEQIRSLFERSFKAIRQCNALPLFYYVAEQRFYIIKELIEEAALLEPYPSFLLMVCTDLFTDSEITLEDAEYLYRHLVKNHELDKTSTGRVTRYAYQIYREKRLANAKF